MHIITLNSETENRQIKESQKNNYVVVGCLHRDNINSKNKRVQLQHGGGTRILPEEAMVNHLLEKAKDLFSCGEKSQKGHLCNTKSESGNFQHKVIKSFQDRDGNEVTFPKYLKSYGLYAGRTYLFLMTTGIEANGHSSPLASKEEESCRCE